MELITDLFSPSDFMPHGYCYLWNPGLVSLHLVSDALIALSYFSIPITLVYFIRKRRDLPSSWIFVCFGAFILACGATHAMEIWNLWHANYWLSGGIKAVTALASVATAILLVRLIPRALALPSPEALRHEIAERRLAEEALHRAKPNWIFTSRSEPGNRRKRIRSYSVRLPSARRQKRNSGTAKGGFACWSRAFRTTLFLCWILVGELQLECRCRENQGIQSRGGSRTTLLAFLFAGRF